MYLQYLTTPFFYHNDFSLDFFSIFLPKPDLCGSALPPPRHCLKTWWLSSSPEQQRGHLTLVVTRLCLSFCKRDLQDSLGNFCLKDHISSSNSPTKSISKKTLCYPNTLPDADLHLGYLSSNLGDKCARCADFKQ
ncbi:hypothetical protein ES319_A07G113100v1 [Gossypium barbadense]|uniref:Uncharacterized protein n=1 Tax=Gossypium barbadense TaxID=3634 RepID=A0A5J5V2J4_GOSBA|nr:hypothetical protein ES319_A07G113100v1 [Gossypium barbadense]